MKRQLIIGTLAPPHQPNNDRQNMNIDQEKNAATAKACGWRLHKDCDPALEFVAEMCWIRPGGEDWQPQRIPNYGSDLNAMREAEEICIVSKGHNLWKQFVEHLCEICGEWDYAIHATASQRRDALLRTLGLWKAEWDLK
jgi:hypothetical protein